MAQAARIIAFPFSGHGIITIVREATGQPGAMMLRYRVLAVEDDLDAMKLLRMVLQHMPLEIDHVLTGGEAIAYLDRQLPDLLFLDISLPDMPGWEVLEQIKADDRLKEVRVIILTSHT